jgi:hypothetical protein
MYHCVVILTILCIADDIEAQKAKNTIPPQKPGVDYINPGQDDQMVILIYFVAGDKSKIGKM